MRDELYDYYDRELTYLRKMGAEFAAKHEKVAKRLRLEPHEPSPDPHVERLLEGFAFLAARVHLKLDDDFTEISDAILSLLYPHYLRPVPAMSLVQFHLDPEQALAGSFRVPRGTQLYSAELDGVQCRFATCFETTLWPLTVRNAHWLTPDQVTLGRTPEPDVTGVLRLELQCQPGTTFANLDLHTLRFHLSGTTATVWTLYELLCNNCRKVVVRDLSEGEHRDALTLPAGVVQPAGFDEDDGMLPAPRREFIPYRFLHEYFSFPDKFSFVDLGGFDRIRAADFGNHIEVLVLVTKDERPERRDILTSDVSQNTLRLGCTPIVNLFSQKSEPIPLSQRRPEYPVVADARRQASTRIFSINTVSNVASGGTAPLTFEPFYSHRHTTTGAQRVFWHARRRSSEWSSENGSDVFVSFVDISARPVQPQLDGVTANLTCYNADLPRRLRTGDEFRSEGGGPIKTITLLAPPTPVVHPPTGRSQLWRLISQLTLNYLSLVEGGADALREQLRLHNLSGSVAADQQIQGILDITGAPCYARVDGPHGPTFARGNRVAIHFDEDQFAGASVYLFASVLERFLALYSSLNSFSVLAVTTTKRKMTLREWPPSPGWRESL